MVERYLEAASPLTLTEGLSAGELVGTLGLDTAALAGLLAAEGTLAVAGHTHAALYAPLGHDHDSAYSALGHDHAGVYSLAGHNHTGVYAPLVHNHDAAYAAASHAHADLYSPLGHNHNAAYLPLAGGTLTGGLTLGTDGASTEQKSLRLNTGIAGTYLLIYANPDGGCGFNSTGGGTFTFNMNWRIDFRSAQDVCFTASRYVDIKDRDGSDAVRARFDTANGALWLTGALAVDGGATIAGAVIKLTNLPLSDPGVAGQVWNNAGYLCLSEGV